jgi:hypothetical protein
LAVITTRAVLCVSYSRVITDEYFPTLPRRRHRPNGDTTACNRAEGRWTLPRDHLPSQHAGDSQPRESGTKIPDDLREEEHPGYPAGASLPGLIRTRAGLVLAVYLAGFLTLRRALSVNKSHTVVDAEHVRSGPWPARQTRGAE